MSDFFPVKCFKTSLVYTQCKIPKVTFVLVNYHNEEIVNNLSSFSDIIWL